MKFLEMTLATSVIQTLPRNDVPGGGSAARDCNASGHTLNRVTLEERWPSRQRLVFLIGWRITSAIARDIRLKFWTFFAPSADCSRVTSSPTSLPGQACLPAFFWKTETPSLPSSPMRKCAKWASISSNRITGWCPSLERRKKRRWAPLPSTSSPLPRRRTGSTCRAPARNLPAFCDRKVGAC